MSSAIGTWLSDRIKELEDELNGKKDELANIEDKKKELEDKLKSKENEVAKLEDELKDKRNELDGEKDEVAKLEDELKRKEGQLANIEDKKKELEDKLKSKENEVAKLKTKLKRVEGELKESKSKKENLTIKWCKLKLEEAYYKLKLKKECYGLKELKNKKKVLEGNQEKCNRIKEAIRKREDKIKRLDNEYRQIEQKIGGEIKKREDKIKRLDNEYRQIEQKIGLLEYEIPWIERELWVIRKLLLLIIIFLFVAFVLELVISISGHFSSKKLAEELKVLAGLPTEQMEERLGTISGRLDKLEQSPGLEGSVNILTGLASSLYIEREKLQAEIEAQPEKSDNAKIDDPMLNNRLCSVERKVKCLDGKIEEHNRKSKEWQECVTCKLEKNQKDFPNCNYEVKDADCLCREC